MQDKVERVGSVVTAPYRAHRFFDALFALIVASVVSAIVISLFSGDVRILPIILIGALIFGTVFGFPAYVIAREYGWDRAWIAALTGVLIVAVPTGCSVLANSADGSNSGLSEVVTGLGLGGLCAGLTFWAIMKWPAAWTIGSPWRRTGLNGLAAVAAISATYLMPYPPADPSCHNAMRDGRKSIAMSAQFDLAVDMDQWPVVAEELAAFGTSGQWSIRKDVRPDTDFPWFQVSLCKEPGTNINASNFGGSTVTIYILQPQGGSGWQTEFGALYRRMEARWPGRNSFRDKGNTVPTPDWARTEKTAH